MIAFRSILFAADLSEPSKQAFQAALALAVEKRTRLVVFHAAEPAAVVVQRHGVGELGAVLPIPTDDGARRQALRERLREMYVPATPFDVEYEVREGDPAHEILHAAKKIGADLIALATHGRSGLLRLIAGSVAETVLRGAECPVLTFRAFGAEAPPRRPTAILHPTDFSEDADLARQVARSLAREHGARLVVVSVLPDDLAYGGEMSLPVDTEPTRLALEELRRILDGPDLKEPVATALRRGDASLAILQTAKEFGCDMIVMGSHGRTGIARALMGSVAESVMRDADCPVLTIKRPSGSRRTQEEEAVAASAS